MPTLAELLTNPVSLTVFAIYLALLLWERIAPARPLPVVRGWAARGVIAFAVYFLLSSYLPFLWSEQLLAWQLFDLSALPTAAQVGIGLLVYQCGAYAWHRTMHGSDRLFRVLHQMHHSAERFDVLGAFWFSPMDMVGWIALGSLMLTLVVGLSPAAGTYALYVSTFLVIFQHTNVRTPRWLGYLVQRPESHSVHHQRGVHRYNYCDLPLLDMLFGTFRNPRRFASQQGYWDGASARVLDMLLARDVTRA